MIALSLGEVVCRAVRSEEVEGGDSEAGGGEEMSAERERGASGEV